MGPGEPAFRSAGLAFAEAVGRIPGTAITVEVDVLDVTRSACLALSSELDHAGVGTLIASLDQASGHLHRTDGLAPFPSEDVERVAVALRPVSQHRNDD